MRHLRVKPNPVVAHLAVIPLNVSENRCIPEGPIASSGYSLWDFYA